MGLKRTPPVKRAPPPSPPSPRPSTSFTPLSSQSRPRRTCGPPSRYRDESHNPSSQDQPSPPVPPPGVRCVAASFFSPPTPAVTTPAKTCSLNSQTSHQVTQNPAIVSPPTIMVPNRASAQPAAERHPSHVLPILPPPPLNPDTEEDFWAGAPIQNNFPPPSQQAGPPLFQSQGQGTQSIPPTQLPDITSLPSLEEAHNTYIPTHKWPPKSVRPELTRTLTSLWQRLASNPGDVSLWTM